MWNSSLLYVFWNFEKYILFSQKCACIRGCLPCALLWCRLGKQRVLEMSYVCMVPCILFSRIHGGFFSLVYSEEFGLWLWLLSVFFFFPLSRMKISAPLKSWLIFLTLCINQRCSFCKEPGKINHLQKTDFCRNWKGWCSALVIRCIAQYMAKGKGGDLDQSYP